METEYTPLDLNWLDEDEVMVFGANLAGRHGAGAALRALEFGAQLGVGEGPTGQTYAIPTKDRQIKTLPLEDIARSVKRFLEYAAGKPDLRFYVTRVGCGLAGYTPKKIGPMFKGAAANVILPVEFEQYR